MLAVCTVTIFHFKTPHSSFILTFRYFDNYLCFGNFRDIHPDQHPLQEDTFLVHVQFIKF